MNDPVIDVVSFYMNNAKPAILDAQKQVFDALSIPLRQVCDTCSHSVFLTKFLRSQPASMEAVVFFDIDCVPLDDSVFWRLVRSAISDQSLVGCAQQANHIDTARYWKWHGRLPRYRRIVEKIRRAIRHSRGVPNPPYLKPLTYAGPCFMIIPMKGYRELGSPSLEVEPEEFDAAGRLTHEWQNAGKSVKLLWPTDCELPKFRYGDVIGFGLGTTFDSFAYHAFESTHVKDSDSPERFVHRCNELMTTLRHG